MPSPTTTAPSGDCARRPDASGDSRPLARVMQPASIGQVRIEAVRRGVGVSESIANPILNPPYDSPDRHFEIGPYGPTGQVKLGRRPSESFIPIAPTRKGRKGPAGDVQEELDLDVTGERREKNTLINDLRREVERWRHSGYDRVTPTSRKLLQHWADDTRENRVLFCQREAA